MPTRPKPFLPANFRTKTIQLGGKLPNLATLTVGVEHSYNKHVEL